MANSEENGGRFTAVEGRYSGYTVRDPDGGRIGKVNSLFVDEKHQPEYIGVKMEFFGSSYTLIPADIATVDDSRGFIEVSRPRSMVEDGPAFDADREITAGYENEVRSYYGLEDRDGSMAAAESDPRTRGRGA